MLISETLILVELHKAGSARLKKVLGDLLGGESSTQQTPYADELAAMDKPIVGYVCDPLTWYLAQWRQGCAGKGEIHRRLTNDAKWVQLKARRANRAVKEGAKANAKAIPDGWGAEYAKSQWYANPEDELAFREWIKAVLGVPGLRKLLDHGFGTSAIARLGGLMTYEFFISFVRDAENMEKSVDTMEALQAAHKAGKVTSQFIRAETLDADVRRMLEELGVAIDDAQGKAIDTLRPKAGADEAAILRFYDSPSLRLVAKREAFINQLFDYAPPTPEERAAARAATRKANRAARREGEEKPAAASAPRGDAPATAAPVKSSKPEKAKQRRAERAEKAGATSDESAQPGKAAKAANAVKAARVAKPARAAAGKPAGEKPAKPQKLKRVKNRPAGNDVVEAEE